ncbi:MAG: tetratricopeptide repeat protein [Gammaproteobacteria bacterium]|jgi:tetratricopeptide (TPR) repeat protein|nr:tetratricopeptide repeat protein [Gammaproteobacteria bacterium]
MNRPAFLFAVFLSLAQLPAISAHATDSGYRPLDEAARTAHRLYTQAGGVPAESSVGFLLAVDPARPDTASIAAQLPSAMDPLAWLAREWMYRDRRAEAESLLSTPASAAQAERIVLRAQLLLSAGRYAAAVTALEQAGRLSQPWAAYADYNRAAALERAGQHDAALQALDALGRITPADPEVAALRDRANITLGFRQLVRNDAAAARAAFERVRLDSPFSSGALLGMGWVEFSQGNLSRALIPWSALRQRDAADPAVREVMLLVPYVQWRVGAHRDAVKSYRDTISGLDAELVAVDRILAGLRNGAMLDNLLGEVPQRVGAILADGTLRAALDTWQYLRILEARAATLPQPVRSSIARANADHRVWLQGRITAALEAERQRVDAQRARAHFELARLLDDVAARRGEP